MSTAEPPAELPSKSQRKRDMKALHSLAEALVRLSPGRFAALALPDPLRDALALARRLERGAYRRQIRYLGKLLRDTDHQALRDAVAGDRESVRRENARLHRLERWRERLVEGGDEVLGDLVAAFPGVERQHVRALVRKIHDERAAQRAPAASRALLRYLRDVIALAVAEAGDGTGEA